jgi:hypothetical protein
MRENILSNNSIQAVDCLFCVSKHLSQAYVLCVEALQGYLGHRWLAIGHLAEAERECINEYPGLSNKIRELRVVIAGQDEKEKWKLKDITDLLMEIRVEAAKKNGFPEEEHLFKYYNDESDNLKDNEKFDLMLKDLKEMFHMVKSYETKLSKNLLNKIMQDLAKQPPIPIPEKPMNENPIESHPSYTGHEIPIEEAVKLHNVDKVEGDYKQAPPVPESSENKNVTILPENYYEENLKEKMIENNYPGDFIDEEVED